ncbi:MAG: BlaI/MecI/CopY family transcriptional regulator [Actinomycetota bacterium]
MRAFGELEDQIMRFLWQRNGRPATVREVHAALTRKTPLAYTTVMTVLDRLWRKGLVERKLQGRAYEYAPVTSQAEHMATLMHQLLVRSKDRRAALAHFVERMREKDEAELIQLAQELARRRKKR